MPFKRLLRETRAGWAGVTTALREIAQRTDRSVQFARLRLDQWELGRELTFAYRSFGQRVAELVTAHEARAAGPLGGAPGAATDDPELHRLTTVIGRHQSRIESLAQRLASLHLEEPEQATVVLRQRLRAAGFVEVVARISTRSLHLGKRLADLQKRGEWLVIAVVRRGAPFVPDGATIMTAGDELLLAGPASACERAKITLEELEPSSGPDAPAA
jgi:K+/H+ antiporter YhaU regulatory subunit KhtT